MQYYLKDNGKNTLTVMFLGWAMDEKPFLGLNSAVSDVLYVWDYNDIKIDFDFSKYEFVDVISFSYGVFISSLFAPFLSNLRNLVALNGTLIPVDKHLGITPMKFELTLKALPERFSDKFYKSMFDNDEDYEKFLEVKPERDLSGLKSELQNIKNLAEKNQNKNCNVCYSRAIISKNDKLIPTSNQFNFWQNRAQITTIEGGHFPFFQFNSVDEIMSL